MTTRSLSPAPHRPRSPDHATRTPPNPYRFLPLPAPDLRAVAARCRPALAVGRAALRGAAADVGARVALGVLALPLLWDVVR